MPLSHEDTAFLLTRAEHCPISYKGAAGQFGGEKVKRLQSVCHRLLLAFAGRDCMCKE